MAISVKKLFPKPEAVLARDYNIYCVIVFACICACLMSVVLSVLLFFSASLKLIILAIVPAVSAILINHYNQRGQHFVAVIFLFILTYIFSFTATLYFGWHAGFQYYLMAEVVMFILYPYLDMKYLFSFGVLAILTFLTLFLTLESINPAQSHLNFILHTINASIAIILLCAANLFFRINAQNLIAKLNHRANIDPLTGLMSRISMQKNMLPHIADSEADNQPSALILFNVDLFKQVNKKWGHDTGDNILAQLAQRFVQGLKETDILARWGSDEFLILAPYTFSKAAIEQAETIRKCIATHSFIHNDDTIKLTVSAAVGIIRSPVTLEIALTHVDDLISKAKLNGRNQVCAHSLTASTAAE